MIGLTFVLLITFPNSHMTHQTPTSSAITARPWRQEAYYDYIAIYDGMGTRVADVCAAPSVDQDRDARFVARLIVAAPELLKACRSVVAHRDCANDGRCATEPCSVCLCTAAIAKVNRND